MKRGLVIVGALLVAAGLLLGFLPQSAGGVSCGSVFRASSDSQVSDLVDSLSGAQGSAVDDCDDRRALYQPVVWLLIGLGAAACVSSVFVREQTRAS